MDAEATDDGGDAWAAGPPCSHGESVVPYHDSRAAGPPYTYGESVEPNREPQAFEDAGAAGQLAALEDNINDIKQEITEFVKTDAISHLNETFEREFAFLHRFVRDGADDALAKVTKTRDEFKRRISKKLEKMDDEVARLSNLANEGERRIRELVSSMSRI